MNTYTTHQMYININSIQLSITYYIQAPRKRCNDEVNSRFLPFTQVWSQIPSNTTTASSAQNKNTKLDF